MSQTGALLIYQICLFINWPEIRLTIELEIDSSTRSFGGDAFLTVLYTYFVTIAVEIIKTSNLELSRDLI